MSPVLIVLVALLGAALITGLVLTIVFTVLRRLSRRMEATIRERFSTEQVRRSHAFANYFGRARVGESGRARVGESGRTSLGAGQVRGNGPLVLTDEVLWFQMAVPTCEVSLPLTSITSVDARRSHLGKRVGRDLLHVEALVDGKTEGFAWLVDDLAGWRADLDAARDAASAARPHGASRPR